ncbi:DUF5810 domain-containing protein [Halospeciosus flavus]|uniref:DUF5810 domain-containing protein n=1 Tax=Halospeciosus flavus TaxID=3032283 RepID=A0ABD5Z6I5_9EURY|nr:DUF5810 domain-containing protein [Halospeciosus flavus]
MGYACPVCATPQADDEHLANHLAFTALLGDEEHETWLDEHVPGWEDAGPDELAPEVVEFAEETEYEEVFEDTTDQQRRQQHAGGHEGHDGHDHGEESFEDRMARELGGDDDDSDERSHAGHDHSHDHGHQHGHGTERPGQQGTGAIDVAGADSLDDEAQDILEEAHELTREMYDDERDGAEEDDGRGDGASEDESE